MAGNPALQADEDLNEGMEILRQEVRRLKGKNRKRGLNRAEVDMLLRYTKQLAEMARDLRNPIDPKTLGRLSDDDIDRLADALQSAEQPRGLAS